MRRNILLVAGVFALCIVGVCGAKTPTSTEDRIQHFRALAPQVTPYAFGSVLELKIVPDKTVMRFKCSENPDDIDEILIGSEGKLFFVCYVLTSGSARAYGSDLSHTIGCFRQIGGSAVVVRWKPEAKVISLTFQLTNDSQTLVKAYRDLEKAGGFSKSMNNASLLFGEECSLAPRLTREERVEGFVRLWSTVKYNFANFDLVPTLNWDKVLPEYLPRVMKEQSNEEYNQLLTACIAKLKDGHSNVSLMWAGLPAACPPLRIQSVGGKAIIVELGMIPEIKASGLNRGDEILKVDGSDVRKVLETKIYPFVFASTPQGRDLRAYPLILQGPPNSKVSVRVKTPKGEVRNVRLTRKANGYDLLPRIVSGDDLEYRELGEGLVYVAINTFGHEHVVRAFEEKFNDMRRAKGVIIDVRKNGGGSSGYGHAIISRLIAKSIPTTRWKTPQHRAAFEAWGRDEKWYDGGYEMIEPGSDPYRGPVVVLIGPETFSAAEDFVVPLHAAHRATIVGQRSGGSTGQPLQFSFLNGKLCGRVCAKRDQYPDGRELVGVGIIPDVEVNPRVEDIVKNHDVVLDRGVEVLKAAIKK